MEGVRREEGRGGGWIESGPVGMEKSTAKRRSWLSMLERKEETHPWDVLVLLWGGWGGPPRCVEGIEGAGGGGYC